MPAVTANAKPAHASTHQPNPERVGQFVSKYINQDRARKAKKRNQPEHRAQREKPKLFPCPKPLHNRYARECGKKCLTENCADWQKKNRKNEFHPARRDRERIGHRNEG